MQQNLTPFDGQLDDTTTSLKPFDGTLDGEKPKASGALRRVVGDTAVSLGRGIIGVPEAAVGLADLATNGQAGKLAESAGLRFKQAKDILAEQYSPEQQAANKAVQDAKGFFPTVGAMVENPSTIVNQAVESLPSAGVGGVAARGLMAAVPKMGAITAGALGEGITAAGQNAEQVRQEDPNGTLTPKQSAILGASGLLTAGISRAAGGVANKMGIGDVQTMLASGKLGPVGEEAIKKGAEKSLIRRVGEGALTEGVLQELPQSYQEQVGQNLAQGKPWDEGAAAAGAQGMMAGALMGAGGNVLHSSDVAPQPQPETKPQPPLMLGNTPDPLIAFPDGTVGRQKEVDAYLANLPEDQRAAARARLMGLGAQPATVTAEPVPLPVKPSEAMGLDPAAGPMSSAATVAVDSGAHANEIQLSQASEADQAAYNSVDLDSADKPISSGPIAESAMSDDDKRAVLYSNQPVSDGGQRYAGTQDGDILNGAGAPFASWQAAGRRASMEGKAWAIAKVADGFVARRKDAVQSQKSETPDWEAQAMAEERAARHPQGNQSAVSLNSARPPQGASGTPSNPLPQFTTSTQPAMSTQTVAKAGPQYDAAAIQSYTGKAPATDVDTAAHSAATSHLNDRPEPTQAQKEAGNYAKGHANINGLDISIENPAGSVRRGVDKDGTPWENQLQHHYGYIKGTVGNDKDHFDLFVKPGTAADYAGPVYVVDQIHPHNGKFDEHKALVGFASAEEAKAAYHSNYADGWQGMKGITEMGFDQFKEWVKNGPKNKPVATDSTYQPATTGDSNGNQAAQAQQASPQEQEAGNQAPAGRAESATQANSSQPGGSGVQVAAVGRKPSQNKAEQLSNAEQKPQPAANQAALDRIAAGDAWFGNELKALNWLQKNGLAASHDVKMAKPGRFKVVQKQAASLTDAAQEAINNVADGSRDATAEKTSSTTPGPDQLELANETPSGIPGSASPVVSAGVGSQATDGGAASVATQTNEFKAEKPANLKQGVAKIRAKKVADANARRADYFTPGNIVKSYGGHDEVLEYTPPDGDGQWSVKVHAIRYKGGKWVRIGKPQDARTHRTEPNASDLKAGPVARLGYQPASEVTYTDSRADGQTFQNAPDRGVAPQDQAESTVFADQTTTASQTGANSESVATTPAEVKADQLAPASKTPLTDTHAEVMAAVRDGKATPEQFKSSFAAVSDNPDAVKTELATRTKEQLLRAGGYFFYQRNKSETKADIVESFYRAILGEYALGKEYGPQGYTMGQERAYERAKSAALAALVDGQTAETLAEYAAEVSRAREEAAAKKAASDAALQNPQTLNDYRNVLRESMKQGKTFKEARLMLTPEQRARYDELDAESTRESREARKRAAKTEVKAAGQTVGGEIVATKHTRDGYDLFVVKLAERVSKEDYGTILAAAKKLGGWYSAFRGNGAIPGFQFMDKPSAEAFLKLAAGDTTAAQEQVAQSRDAFEDDRSQTAVERLTEMADRLDDRANASLGQERKANTARRARFAASAEASAQGDKALAQTMRNIASAIQSGAAKFLDAVRQKTQVEMLNGFVRTAQDQELRATYPTYAEQEKHKGAKPTAETADFADFPSYTAYRSDLASLARQLLEVDGTKKLGQSLMKVADDTSDAYTAFVKENSHKVMAFSSRDGGLAAFGTKDAAQAAINRSGFKGKAVPYQVKRGQYTVILSPSEAIERGIWKGDGDKRITLSREYGAELVQAIGRRANKTNRLTVPWQFESAHDRLKALSRMGIETPAEFRSALREFIALREQAAEPDKVKEMERAMIGRRNDGLDFFPTPQETADSMVDAAGIEPGMSVLEPSAGMGHIAERIREAGAEPDVVEMATDRKELLEAKGFNVVGSDFTDMQLDATPDGSGYDRIVMNPPFSNGRDMAHVQHAYSLLRPGGRLVALMGESAFTNQGKRATEFREWLDQVGGTDEKLAEGTFQDPSLPVNTGANARMVVIDRPLKQVDGDDSAMFSRATSAETNALKALSDTDEIFAYPKSDKSTVQEIAADNDPGIKVKETKIAGETLYTLTMPNGEVARLWVRPPNPYGERVYGMDLVDGEAKNQTIGRPGENPEAVPADVDDVYLDVSKISQGNRGALAYNIASTFAHNTGRIFIGDPNGLSRVAMHRRLENMISTALKFGTTDHIAPHPDQVKGDASIGVPPLKWVYGDSVGNIRRMIDVSLKAMENSVLKPYFYEPATGTFTNTQDRGRPVERVAGSASGELSGVFRTTPGWSKTRARAAVFNALLRESGKGASGEVGGRNGLLEGLVSLQHQHADSIQGIFYSRDEAEGDSLGQNTTIGTGSAPQAVSNVVEAIKANWANAPEVVVASSMQDTAVPERVRAYDQEQRSMGSSGNVEGFYYGGKVYLLADQLASDADVARVLFHETLGHYGLRSVFGKSLNSVLNRVAMARKSEVDAKMAQYGLKGISQLERLTAAEEVLAEMAQTTPTIGFVRDAIAAIRTWLRENIPGFKNLALTDDEIIRSYILPARNFVERSAAPRMVESPAQTLAMASRAQQKDASNADIRFSRSATLQRATDTLNEVFNHPGTVSKWHTTVGSMYNLAERSPAFKKVFDAAQGFLNDVSYYATEAADQAPKILPKLESIKDMAKSPITFADNDAISAPIFQGTLSWARDVSGKPVRIEDLEAAAADKTADEKAQDMLRAGKLDPAVLRMWQGMKQDQYAAAVNSRYESTMLRPGVVWADSELRSLFKLSDAQIGLYKEFRSAIDASIDNTAKAGMLRVAGKDAQALRDMVMDAPTAEIAGLALRDHFQAMAGDEPGRSDQHIATANQMMDLADKATKLKAEGYAPLSRFGQYTVDVVVNGERKYFGLFESKRAANQRANLLAQEHGRANVIQGTLSQREFEQFQGITPESLELFGNMLGLDSTGDETQDKVFQTYLRMTKANRSAMKKLIHRKGIAGFSEDVGRVLASFVYSNARQTAGALNLGKLGDAVNAIPKGQGELKDVAIGLQQYITKPIEEAQAVRGMMFAQYLGGSIASAMVNLTQPMAVSFPYLSQFGGARKSAAELAKAYADMVKGEKALENGLQKALRAAEEQGVVAPQEVHQLMAQARGQSTLHGGDGTRIGDLTAKANNAFTKLALGWGKLFGVAEQINRRATFIAAYRMAVDQGMANPAEFATKAVNETQFINNRGNKMRWGRGAVGATLMTFKSYSINYLELLHRMATKQGPEGKRAALLMLGMLVLMAGAGGLPFADDLNDLVDFMAERMGYNFSAKKKKQEFLEDVFGKAMADFIDRGVTGLPGSPIDVSGRLSMANLIPGTGLLLEKRDHSRDAQELLGPVGDMAKRAFDGANAVLDGDAKRALLSVAPKAISNAFQGADMADKDYYADAKGFKVLSTTPGEAFAKAIGFQPQSVSMVQEANAITQRMKDTYALHAEQIRAEWAKGVFEHDPDQIQKARDMLKDWNDKNPDQRIIVRIPDVMKKAREMAKDKAQRIADTAPKVMRAQLKKEVQDRKALQ